MHARDPDDRNETTHHGSHRSEISGTVSDAVQARDISGGIHFHNPTGPARLIPKQLPGDVSGFVNRNHELEVLSRVLSDEREEPLVVGLYVITGTAGVGKTSLALHWAHSVQHYFPAGQLYVNLRGYDAGPSVSAEQALDRFLRALGVQPGSIPSELEDMASLYRSLLAEQRMLIILDNAATVKQVRPLLPGNAECLVLVTSRNRLSGLVARDGARRLQLDTLSDQDAVSLLRTITSRYRTEDRPEDLSELARLCARLPLALRIAAERASSRPLMRLSELIADLRDESALWDALTAEDDNEADAVRTVFAWSYRALPEQAARLFRFLGLHPGPEFSVAAAATIADTSASQARQLLDVLVGTHLLEQHTPGRYQFHDLLRAYAAEQASQHETPESRRHAVERVLAWYAQTLANAVVLIAPHDRQIPVPTSLPDLVAGNFATREEAFNWCETERVNLVSAVRSASNAGFLQLTWRIPAILRSIYVSQNPFQDWFMVSHLGLEAARRTSDRYGEAEVLDSLGKAYLQSQQLDQAEACHEAALAIRQDIGDRHGMMVSTNAIGLLHWRRRQLQTAIARFEGCMEIAEELGNRRWRALALTNLGMTHFDLGDLDEAETALRAAVDLCRELGDRAYEGNALFFLAQTQREAGQFAQATTSIEEALAIAEEVKLHAWGAFWLAELARIQVALDRPADALTTYQRSAVTQRQLGDRNREAMALNGTGEAYRALDRPDEAVKFHQLAAAVHRDVGDQWQLSQALTNLGLAHEASGDPQAAVPPLEEAVALLEGFGDPRAIEQRHRIGDLVRRLRALY